MVAKNDEPKPQPSNKMVAEAFLMCLEQSLVDRCKEREAKRITQSN